MVLYLLFGQTKAIEIDENYSNYYRKNVFFNINIATM